MCISPFLPIDERFFYPIVAWSLDFRVHFDHEKPENGELSFYKGDIFQVTDTLYNGTVGSWQAVKVSSPMTAVSEPHKAVDSAMTKGVFLYFRDLFSCR